NHVAHHLAQIVARSIADGPLDASQLGHAAADVLKTGGVGLSIRDMLDAQVLVYRRSHHFGEPANSHRLVAAEVEDLADGGRTGHQVEHGTHDVGDVGETAH